MILTFKKLANRWFADIPNWIGSVDDLQMVDGADEFIEHIANGYETIIVEISPFEINDPEYIWKKTSEDAFGAFYKETISDWKRIMWLCPVTIHCFAEYPEKLYIKKIYKY